jgi:hypothetical protein
MRLPKNRQKLVWAAMLTLLLTLMLPAGAVAGQGQSERGRNHDKRDRKCEKFVNCHDASDGRVDGKGPGHRRSSASQRRQRAHNRRHAARLRNRTNNGFEVREKNRLNNARIRRIRG